MYRSIMVPLDGSALGHRALNVAVPLACTASATVHLVHIRTTASAPMLYDQSEEPERAYLEAVAKEVADDTGLTVNTSVIQDPLSVILPAARPNRTITEALRNYVRDHDVELVVMSSHGWGGFRRAWLGSVADALVRDCPAPVMVVTSRHGPAGITRGQFRLERILLPLDGSAEAEAAIEPALQLASAGPVHLTLFHAVEPIREPANPYVHWVLPSINQILDEERLRAWEYLKGIGSRLRSETVDVHLEVSLTMAAAGILCAAKTHVPDVIVIATHGAGGAKRLLLGSVADKVVRSAPMPVLVVHSSDGQAASRASAAAAVGQRGNERC